jgi:septal ring factor EnvC (AmiA/AmiB activator)
MIPAISNTQYPVNQLLRQQTERQAQQAELQAQMLEQQAAAKRREARQAQQTARDLDAAASESANRAKVLQQNLAAADRLSNNQQQLSERLNATRQPEQPPSSTTDGSNSPTITNRSAAISTDSSRAQNLNASAVFNSIAKPPGPSTGLAINLQI